MKGTINVVVVVVVAAVLLLSQSSAIFGFEWQKKQT